MRTFRFRVNDAPGGNYVDTTSAAEATDELLRQYCVDLAFCCGPSIVDFSESRKRTMRLCYPTTVINMVCKIISRNIRSFIRESVRTANPYNLALGGVTRALRGTAHQCPVGPI